MKTTFQFSGNALYKVRSGSLARLSILTMRIVFKYTPEHNVHMFG